MSIINPEFYGEFNRPRPASWRVFNKLKAFKILFTPIFRIGFKKILRPDFIVRKFKRHWTSKLNFTKVRTQISCKTADKRI